MQCITPMFRYYDSSKTCDSNAKIIPRSQVLKNLTFDKNHIRHSVQEFNEQQENKYSPMRMQTIPCGHCWACKLTYSANWATRCMVEAQEHEHNYFITLTYDDKHLPNPKLIECEGKKFFNDGSWTGTLEPKHVTNFIKRLRKHYKVKGIKYFYCGEYGSKPFEEGGARPHYHMLLFGAPLDIKQFHAFHIDERYKMHWKSKELEELWEYGMHDCAELEWSCAAYVSRYCAKKIFNEPKSKKQYAKMGKIPEFVRMSRRPGIGMSYFYDNMAMIYENDEMIMKTVKGRTGSYKPPKAFDKKFKELFPEEWEQIKISRQKAAERSEDLQRQISDYNDLELLEIKEQRLDIIGKQLPRELE